MNICIVLTFTHSWISKLYILMRYVWPLLLLHNRLNVNINMCTSDLHEIEQCQSVSLPSLDVLHCREVALADVSAAKHAGH